MIIGTCVPVGSELSVKDHARLSSFEDLKNLNEDGYRLVFVNLKGTYSMPCDQDDEACITMVNIDIFPHLIYMPCCG